MLKRSLLATFAALAAFAAPSAFGATGELPSVNPWGVALAQGKTVTVTNVSITSQITAATLTLSMSSSGGIAGTAQIIVDSAGDTIPASLTYTDANNWTFTISGGLASSSAPIDLSQLSGTIADSGGTINGTLSLAGYGIGTSAPVTVTLTGNSSGWSGTASIPTFQIGTVTFNDAKVTVSTSSPAAVSATLVSGGLQAAVTGTVSSKSNWSFTADGSGSIGSTSLTTISGNVSSTSGAVSGALTLGGTSAGGTAFMGSATFSTGGTASITLSNLAITSKILVTTLAVTKSDSSTVTGTADVVVGGVDATVTLTWRDSKNWSMTATGVKATAPFTFSTISGTIADSSGTVTGSFTLSGTSSGGTPYTGSMSVSSDGSASVMVDQFAVSPTITVTNLALSTSSSTSSTTTPSKVTGSGTINVSGGLTVSGTLWWNDSTHWSISATGSGTVGTISIDSASGTLTNSGGQVSGSLTLAGKSGTNAFTGSASMDTTGNASISLTNFPITANLLASTFTVTKSTAATTGAAASVSGSGTLVFSGGLTVGASLSWTDAKNWSATASGSGKLGGLTLTSVSGTAKDVAGAVSGSLAITGSTQGQSGTFTGTASFDSSGKASVKLTNFPISATLTASVLNLSATTTASATTVSGAATVVMGDGSTVGITLSWTDSKNWSMSASASGLSSPTGAAVSLTSASGTLTSTAGVISGSFAMAGKASGGGTFSGSFTYDASGAMSGTLSGTNLVFGQTTFPTLNLTFSTATKNIALAGQMKSDIGNFTMSASLTGSTLTNLSVSGADLNVSTGNFDFKSFSFSYSAPISTSGCATFTTQSSGALEVNKDAFTFGPDSMTFTCGKISSFVLNLSGTHNGTPDKTLTGNITWQSSTSTPKTLTGYGYLPTITYYGGFFGSLSFSETYGGLHISGHGAHTDFSVSGDVSMQIGIYMPDAGSSTLAGAIGFGGNLHAHLRFSIYTGNIDGGVGCSFLTDGSDFACSAYVSGRVSDSGPVKLRISFSKTVNF